MTSNAVLQRILQNLRSRNDAVRAKAAKQIRNHVEKTSREKSGESFSNFIDELNSNIHEMVNSRDTNDRIGAIMAIDKLITLNYEDPRKITRFSNYLRNTLTNQHSDATTVVMVTKALGRLARASALTTSKTLTAEWVEFESKRALEWLEDNKHRDDGRRYAAVLVLKELAENAPTLFYAHVGPFLQHIWNGLRDPNVLVREGSILALRAVLALISERSSLVRVEWYHEIYNQVHKGLKSKTFETIHGSLLALGELLRNTGSFLAEQIDDVCSTVLKYHDHKEKLIRIAVISLIPTLASFYKQKFNEKYLQKSMTFLLAVFAKNNDKDIRAVAYEALGQLCVEVGSEGIQPYVEQILNVVKDGLIAKRNRTFVPQALVTLSMLGQTIGDLLSKEVLSMLDSMFSAGLSVTLTTSLSTLVKTMPSLLKHVQERMLDTISLILARSPYSPVNYKLSLPPATTTELNEQTIALALKTLGTFDMGGHNLIDFVNDCVVSYLDNDSSKIRKEAARTSCKLLVSQGKPPVKGHYGFIVGNVLEKLLTVAITDPDPSIRYAVLSSLDNRFDHYLALADNLRSLFIALNDESFAIRVVAIGVIGRLSTQNPAYVLPSLRKTLLQLLTELEYSEDPRNKEESASMLGHLIEAAPRLIKPYVASILKVLMARIRDPNASVSACVLDSTGKLAIVGGNEIIESMDQLLPLVIEALSDQSSTSKKAIAIRTLGRLVESTGYVMTPYLKYPKLLNTLLSILKTEEEWTTRREVMKVLGIIGAIDPYKHNSLQFSGQDNGASTINSTVLADTTVDMPGVRPSSEEYYPTVAFTALMKILTDPSLSAHHTDVIQAVMFIFTSLGLKCVSFLPQIMPPFLNLIRSCESNIRNSLFQHLSVLVSIVKQHIRNYLDDIFQLIQDFWKGDSKIQIITLEAEISMSLNEEFKPYLPEVIPQLIGVLQSDKSSGQVVSMKALSALVIFGKHLEDFLYLVIPAVVRMFESSEAADSLKAHAIKTIGKLCRSLNFAEYSSRIIHPLSRVLPIVELRQHALNTLCSLVYNLGADFVIFVPMVKKVMAENHIVYPKYDDLVNNTMKNLPIAEPQWADDDEEKSIASADDSALNEVKKMHVNQTNLKRAWEASQRSTKEDWIEWIRGFSVELLKESPSPALRGCSPLAQHYHPLARELFNAGFVSCWTELDDKAQAEVVRALEIAFSSPNLPPEVLQTLLNLAEFMEHDEKPLPIAIKALGALAEKCQAYAKALHYKEIEFHENPGSLIEDLISINNQLQQHEAAMGILKYAQKTHSIELKESWYEKLQRWQEAHDAYEAKQKQHTGLDQPTDFILGRMRCLRALGEWEKLFDLSRESWAKANTDFKYKISPLAAAAAWNLSQWEFMQECVNYLQESSPEGSFFRAIIAINSNQYPVAQKLIDETRQVLDRELTALVAESYNRAYDVIVRVQQLSEMEEVIQYKLLTQEQDTEKKTVIKKIWTDRLRGCKRNVEHWQNILSVRKLVLPPEEDRDVWLKFAALSRKSGKLQLSQKTLAKLIKGFDPVTNPELLLTQNVHPRVAYEYFKHLRAEPGKQQEAFHLLSKFVQMNASSQNDSQLVARCFLTLGKWQSDDSNFDEALIPQILQNLKASTEFDPNYYKAWHSWALMNSEVVRLYEKKKAKNVSTLNNLVAAVHGFFRSISLSPDNSSSLQDILRLLTLWFKHGAKKEVEKTLMEGFNTVNIDTWLQVIPQLIARINSNALPIRKLIHDLLIKVGKAHPQALIYPLTVSSKSQAHTRRQAAEQILSHMRQHSATLVDQALLVSNELIRVAILWNELWHEGLEEASRLYFGEQDVEGMFQTLAPLHKMMVKADTLSEVSFQQAYGRDLEEALEWCTKYKKSGKEADLNQAWDLYYQVFRRINKQLNHMVKLELQFVSPKLLQAENLELAVPGTYRSDAANVVRIGSFARQLKVFFTKQRPRKLKMYGVDGNEYQFLLKGHEDLRQDERVMQLFGLVNTLLANDSETSTRDLAIKRYAVIPLSSNAGLIGWVDNCDTLHALIKEYRESRNVLLNIEHRLMIQMAPDYDNLSLIQKIEVFEYALENTTGQDLYKVLWLKSRSSEVWLYRRTNYTRSLAVMSMVGYILGLGDRHPSNIMLEKLTGKVVHIDFGDCFEVAMHREKFPEKIPFRLTRMLVNAMEVCGIEGTFRSTCESVMRVLRDNKDSVMAMLEAFVHDPLINWRLLEATNAGATNPQQQLNAAPSSGASESLGSENGTTTGTTISTSARRASVTSIGTMSTSIEENAKQYPSRSVREKELKKSYKNDSDDEADEQPEVLNNRAVSVITRVSNKLTGRDFDDVENGTSLGVPDQVQRLIEQATSHANLCQCYIGWCAFW